MEQFINISALSSPSGQNSFGFGKIYSVFKFAKEIQLKKLVDQIFVVFLCLSVWGNKNKEKEEIHVALRGIFGPKKYTYSTFYK